MEKNWQKKSFEYRKFRNEYNISQTQLKDENKIFETLHIEKGIYNSKFLFSYYFINAVFYKQEHK